MLPVDEPVGKDSSGELAMEEEEVALKTKFPAKERVVKQKTLNDFAKPPKCEVTDR